MFVHRKVKTLGVNKEGGVPDGMALDHEGRIWTALCGGGAIVCIDPETGKELHRSDVCQSLHYLLSICYNRLQKSTAVAGGKPHATCVQVIAVLVWHLHSTAVVTS